MVKDLEVGETIPPFFVKDHEGYDVSDEDVIGSPLVIYFYPKDETPGCTLEACAFQKHIGEFDHFQTLVIGVSPDSVKSHKKFIKKHRLEFSLLSDESKDMCRMYGALSDEGEVIRTTYVIDSRGVIRWLEKPVEVEGHIKRVLEALEEFCKDDPLRYDDYKYDYAEFLKEELAPSKEEKPKKKKES